VPIQNDLGAGGESIVVGPQGERDHFSAGDVTTFADKRDRGLLAELVRVRRGSDAEVRSVGLLCFRTYSLG
jgi:hypothetical protein